MAGPFFGGRFFDGGFFGAVATQGGGTSKRDKKRKVIRRSQLRPEEYEEQLQALVSELEIKPFPVIEPDEDDEILLMVLARVLH